METTTELTNEQIDALEGAELDRAVAEAFGWRFQKKFGWFNDTEPEIENRWKAGVRFSPSFDIDDAMSIVWGEMVKRGFCADMQELFEPASPRVAVRVVFWKKRDEWNAVGVYSLDKCTAICLAAIKALRGKE